MSKNQPFVTFDHKKTQSRADKNHSFSRYCGFPFLLPGPLPSGRSTSVKTAPKPLTFAGTVPLEPGTKNSASVMLLSTGVNSRKGLKILKEIVKGG